MLHGSYRFTYHLFHFVLYQTQKVLLLFRWRWQMVVCYKRGRGWFLHESQCQYLSPLKENGVNCGIERSAGSDYTMDEVATYNEEYDSQSSMIMQGARNTADYVTRRHVNIAIKLVYQLQSDEENWTPWPDLLEHYHEVQAIYKTFSMIVQG